MHRTYVDGKPVGLFVSRRGETESPNDTTPFFVFRRNGLGDYVLEGYAAHDGRRMRTYQLPGHEVDTWQLVGKLGGPPGREKPANDSTEDTVILLAGARN